MAAKGTGCRRRHRHHCRTLRELLENEVRKHHRNARATRKSLVSKCVYAELVLAAQLDWIAIDLAVSPTRVIRAGWDALNENEPKRRSCGNCTAPTATMAPVASSLGPVPAAFSSSGTPVSLDQLLFLPQVPVGN